MTGKRQAVRDKVKGVSRFLMLGILLLQMQAPANAQRESQPAIIAPPLDQLEPYVLEIPTYAVSHSSAADLEAELEAQIGDLIATRYAPLIFTPGKIVTRFYFHDPATLFYTLSIALPYLSPGLQVQVKDYLAQEWDNYNPLTTNSYPLSQGERREYYPIGTEALDYAYTNPDSSKATPDRTEILYAVWAYAYYANRWDIVSDNWNTIQNLIDDIDPSSTDSLLGNPNSWSTGSINRPTASLIAYTRMADYMNDDAAYAWGLDAATHALAARIDYEETHRPATGEWHTGSSSGGKFVQRSGSHRTWIPRYQDLTPEIGRALRDYAASDLADQAEYIATVRPMWYLAWGPQVFEGEVSTNFPQHAIDIFNAQAMMLGATVGELRAYLDIPWCRGDLYYIQKLVYTIRTHSATVEKRVDRVLARYGDTLNYTITLIGAGKSTTMTDNIPAGTFYQEGSAQRTPPIGTLIADASTIQWTGTLTRHQMLQIQFAVTVSAIEPTAIINQALVTEGSTLMPLKAVTIANFLAIYLPIILRQF